MNFKIKIEKQDKEDFIVWVNKNTVTQPGKCNYEYPYFFIQNRGFGYEIIRSSTKYFKFKYSKLPEFVWVESLKKPVLKEYCEIGHDGLWEQVRTKLDPNEFVKAFHVDLCNNSSDLEIESYPSHNKLKQMKEYVLKLDVVVSVTKGTYKRYPKGYSVTKLNARWHTSVNNNYFSIDDKYLVSDYYVEEKNPLLSDIVKFGDDLVCTDGRKYKYAGKKGMLGNYFVYDINAEVLLSVNGDFNENFKLNK